MKQIKDPENLKKPAGGVSRRGFIRGVSAGGGALGTGILEQQAEAQGGTRPVGPGPVPITLNVNGKPLNLNVEPRVTLLDALRDHGPNMTGAKRVCDRGNCGACTVIMGGKAVYACSILAIEAQGQEIQTIEGISAARLHPVSAAFVNNDAQQCGYCTPGFVMASKAFLDKNPNPTVEQINHGLGGNLCRCGTYMGVRKAVLEASKTVKGGRNA